MMMNLYSCAHCQVDWEDIQRVDITCPLCNESNNNILVKEDISPGVTSWFRILEIIINDGPLSVRPFISRTGMEMNC